MKQVFKLVLACAVGVLPMSVGAKDSEATEVRKMIDKVNQHWQAENSPEVRSFWDNAVYHTGNMEAYFLTGNETYRAYSETWANYNQWKGAKSDNRAEWKYSYGESDQYVVLILKPGQTTTSGRERRVITVRSGNILTESRMSMCCLVTTRFVSRLIPICTI